MLFISTRHGCSDKDKWKSGYVNDERLGVAVQSTEHTLGLDPSNRPLDVWF